MKVKRLALQLNLASVINIIAAGVLLPVMLATATGIVALVTARDAGAIVIGVLVVCFAAAAAGSGLLAIVFAGRKARLAREQADFVANVSHELRTPLSAIRLYAQTLQSEKLKADPGKTAKCVAAIVRESQWLDVMIERVLTWRASSKDMMQLVMKCQPLTEAVGGAAERFLDMVEAEEISVSTDFKASKDVLHDPGAINMVVLNLLTNAYKYSGREKKVSIRTRDAHKHSIIEIEDNGVGMTAAEARRVFEPFYRGGAERSGASGVGLGLAIAKYLVERHGGELTVTSTPDVGSIFTIRLPHADAGSAP